MSTLEKIRKRPGLVIGIIGFAIVLFIITGVINNFNIFTDHESVAKVDGTKIKYQDLQSRTSQIQEYYKQQSGRDMDYGQLQQQALSYLVQETLLNNAIEDLGITVTDNELQDLLLGENAIPDVYQLAVRYGFETPDELYNYCYSGEENSAELRAVWNKLESDVRQSLLAEKYNRQLDALTTNKLDARTYYDMGARTATLQLARQDYTTIPEDQLNITPEDLKARYNSEKEMFAIPNEVRLVDYILVRTQPSEEDFANAQLEVEQAIDTLRKIDYVDAYALGNFTVKNIKGSETKISDIFIKNAIPDLIGEEYEGVKMVSFNNNEYVIAKLLSAVTMPETAKVDAVVINTTNASVDSVLTVLNGGAEVESLGDIVLNYVKDYEMPFTEANFDVYLSQIEANKGGEFFCLDTTTGPLQTTDENVKVLLGVKEIPEAVQVYEIARISRKVDPSSQTLNNLEEKLRTFLAENPTIEQIKEKVADSEYATDCSSTMVDASMLQMLGLPSSGSAARWAMENKKGDISKIFTDDTRTYLLVLGIEDIYKDYVSLNNPDVQSEIRARVRAEKAGEKIMADIAGKADNVEKYAELMNTSAITIPNVNFNRNYVQGFTNGSGEVLAAVAAAKPGELVGPFITKNGVVVFTITDENTLPREFDLATDTQTFDNAQGASRMKNNLQNILLGNKKVKYKVQRFTNAE